MKKNFDNKNWKIQGADKDGGFGGNVNPSNQDSDDNSMSELMNMPLGAANPNMNFDGGVGHNYTSKNN